MDNYTKGAVGEYLERSRKSLLELFNDPSFPQGAVVDIESRLEGIRQSIEKDLLTDNAYATLIMELEAKKRKIDDSTFYVSLTDIAKIKDPKNPSYVIQGWLRDRNTLGFLYLWEREHNRNFYEMGYHKLKRNLSDPSFTLTAKIWKERTAATGIISKQGNGGGTFAHRDIAIDFYAWVFPEKRYELVKLIAGKSAFFESVQAEIQQMKIDISEDD
ncbi:MAG: KilA-N domain-containing protein [Clostridia bacterium]|nr:KilA-N domain-containing protein [Clostridia bacterium]